MAPQWFFTSRELEQYMPIATRKKWVTTEVGTKVEAFAVAGCDVVNMLRTSKQKADFLKAGIREGITEKLIEITGDSNAQMAYVWYEEDIVHKYGVILVGWTFPELVNPSELSTSLPALQKLHDAIKDNSCRFVKLTGEERADRIAKWKDDVAAGRMEQKTRATRADKGKKRARAPGDDEGDEEENDADTDTAATEPAAARPVKRRRITAKIAPGDIVVEEPNDDDDHAAEPTEVRTVAQRSRPKNGTKPSKRAAAQSARAPIKAKTKAQGTRDDDTTRVVLEKLKARRAKLTEKAGKDAGATSAGSAVQSSAVARPKPRPAFKGSAGYKSTEFVNSDDEREADPDADADDIPAPAASRNAAGAQLDAASRDAAGAEFDAALAQLSPTPA
ncbi:hypothetical protein C8F04DRAFT_1266774 [Mycena alexandri]|uniref:Uncharacterized protein n=1 Tax=Mycena alexandri TaxID=1745969 RepID=A0AAD6SK82_9AGAR|nr:hypothetical protein C8F04DRAFT_1266774 [Mycena alexandri]